MFCKVYVCVCGYVCWCVNVEIGETDDLYVLMMYDVAKSNAVIKASKFQFFFNRMDSSPTVGALSLLSPVGHTLYLK